MHNLGDFIIHHQSKERREVYAFCERVNYNLSVGGGSLYEAKLAIECALAHELCVDAQKVLIASGIAKLCKFGGRRNHIHDQDLTVYRGFVTFKSQAKQRLV